MRSLAVLLARTAAVAGAAARPREVGFPQVAHFFFNDPATTEIYTLSLTRRSSDLDRPNARRTTEIEHSCRACAHESSPRGSSKAVRRGRARVAAEARRRTGRHDALRVCPRRARERFGVGRGWQFYAEATARSGRATRIWVRSRGRRRRPQAGSRSRARAPSPASPQPPCPFARVEPEREFESFVAVVRVGGSERRLAASARAASCRGWARRVRNSLAGGNSTLAS